MDLLEKISYKKSVQGLEDIDAEMAAIEERIRERRKKITLRDDLAIKYEEIIIEMGPEEPTPEIVTEEAINAGTRENKSRREFLKKTAKVGLGLAAGGVLVGVGNLLENEAKRKHKKQAEAPTHPTPVDTVKIETPPIDSVKAEKPAIDSTEIKRLEESRKAEELIKEQKEKFGALYEKIDMHFYNEVLDDVGRLVYLYRVTNQQEQKEHPGYWVMIDKKTGTLHLVDATNKLSRSGSVLTGRETGDALNDQESHLSTPTAFTVLSNENIEDYYREMYGNDLWRIEGTSAYPGEDIFLHGLLGEKGEKEALASKNKEARRKSHGCIRNPKIKEDQKHFISGKTRIAILPDKSGVILNPETKKPEFCKKAELKERLERLIDKNR